MAQYTTRLPGRAYFFPRRENAAPVAHLNKPVRVLLVALGLGWTTDFLFYGKSLGISVLLFVALLLTALFGLSRAEGVRLAYRNLWLLAPALFFAVMIAVRANGFLTAVNLATLGITLCFLLFFFAADRMERLPILGYFAILALSLKNVLAQPTPAVREAVREAATQRERARMAAPLLRGLALALPLLRGLALALPLLIIFTALLASADSIFAGYIGKFFKLNIVEGAPEMAMRQVSILAVAWLVAGALFFSLNRKRESGAGIDSPTIPGRWTLKRGVGFVEGVTVLGLVNALFAFFAWIQISQLFGGEAARTMHFEAFREYVRRGFGELLLVAVLTMCLIIGVRWAVWKETQREVHIFNTLSTLMILLTGVMLVSAFMRMVVWENIDFYISTQLRLYVRAFIVWLGVAFGWLLLTLWVRRDRFAIGAFATVLGFLVTINLMNPDAEVAAHNLARNDELSTRYVWLLSEDAVPALVAGLDTTTGTVRESLRQHLFFRLADMERDTGWQSWPSLHMARQEAYDTLLALRSAGKLASSDVYVTKTYAPGPNRSTPWHYRYRNIR